MKSKIHEHRSLLKNGVSKKTFLTVSAVLTLIITGSAQIAPQNLFKLSTQEQVLFYPPYINTYTWPTVGYEEPPLHEIWNAFDKGQYPVPLSENGGTNDWFKLDGAGSQNHAMLWMAESCLGHALNGNVAQYEVAAKKCIILLDSLDAVQGHMRHEAIASYLDFWEAGAAGMALAGFYAPAGSTSGPDLLKAARKWWFDHVALLRAIRTPDGLLAAVGGRCKGDPGQDEWNLRPDVNMQLLDPQPHNTLNTDVAALLDPDGKPLHGNGGTYQVHWWDPHYAGDKWLVLRAFQSGAILRTPADRPVPHIVQKIYKWTSAGGKINVAAPTVVGYPVRRWHSSWTPGATRIWIEVADSSASAPGGKGLPYGHLPPAGQTLTIPGTAVQIAGYTAFPPVLPACVAAGNCANDLAVVSIAVPYHNGCATTVSPRVVVRNDGTSPITEFALYSQVDNYTLYSDLSKGATRPKRFTVAGGLAPGAAMTVTLDPCTVSVATHTIKVWTMDVNKVTDWNAANDLQSGSFTVVSNGTAALPYVQDFESTSAGRIPADYTLYDADANGQWFVYSTGTNKAAAFNNLAYTGAVNKKDELVMPVINLTGNPSIYLSFDLAHASKPAPTVYDSLEVQVSTDCGATFTSIWGKGGTALNTVADIPNIFIPAGPQDYKNVKIDVSAYNTSAKAIFKFINWSNNGNSTLIDNVKFVTSAVTGVEEGHTISSVEVYPNPASGVVTVNFASATAGEVNVQLINALGQVVSSEKVNAHAGSVDHKLNVSGLNAGIYQVSVSDENSSMKKKIVVIK